jgi:hypothetical protein
MPKPIRTFEPSIANGVRHTAKVYVTLMLPVDGTFESIPILTKPLASWSSIQSGAVRPFYVRKTFLRDNAERLLQPGNEPYGPEGVRVYDCTEL